jgi:HNH endonuclease
VVYDAPAELGALVETAVREAKDALFTAGQTQATLGDALTEVAHRSLSTVASRSRRDHYRVLVHLDTAGGWLNGRPALPAHLVDKLTCEGTLTPVWETQGRPVSVGRAMRIAPRRTRRLVEDRDRGCRFPGCTTVGFLDNHHIHHWRHGGPTDLDHLVSLCPYHHDAVHANQITVTGDPTTPHGLTFRNHAGLEIRGPHYTPPPPPPVSPAAVAAIMTREAGSALTALWQHQPIPGLTPHDTPYRGPTGQQLHPQWVEFTAN